MSINGAGLLFANPREQRRHPLHQGRDFENGCVGWLVQRQVAPVLLPLFGGPPVVELLSPPGGLFLAVGHDEPEPPTELHGEQPAGQRRAHDAWDNRVPAVPAGNFDEP